MRSLLLLGLCAASALPAQTLTPTALTTLNTELNETSGLLVLDGQVWTQLDSGNPDRLYRIDPATGQVLHSVRVTNATNIDWEDISSDANWIYVGDFGNNSGSRGNLCVYRFPRAQLLDPDVNDVLADTIRFSYADQTDFTPADHANNWDCEAMVVMDDSVFVFTKNWLNSRSYLYAFPAIPGVQVAQRRDTLDTQGLVTGASLDPGTGAIALCGYTTTLSPFLWLLTGYPGHAFFRGNAERHALQVPLTQIEGIAWYAPDVVYLTNEHNMLSAARLWEVGLAVPTSVPPTPREPVELERPSMDSAIIRLPKAAVLTVVDGNGRTILRRGLAAGGNTVDLSAWPAGAYVLDLGPGFTPARITITR